GTGTPRQNLPRLGGQLYASGAGICFHPKRAAVFLSRQAGCLSTWRPVDPRSNFASRSIWEQIMRYAEDVIDVSRFPKVRIRQDMQYLSGPYAKTGAVG